MRMAVGDTVGTDFARDFDIEQAAALFAAVGGGRGHLQEPDGSADLGRTIAEFVAMLLAHPEADDPRAHHRARRAGCSR